MGAQGKFDQEMRDRAVRMYRDRVADGEHSRLGARRAVGGLLEVDPATVRNWVEDAERAEGLPARVAAFSAAQQDSEEVKTLKKRVAELERANEILRTALAFSRRRSSTADSSDRGLH